MSGNPTAVTVHHGDCLDILPTLDAESFDSVCCDPPYHLSEVPYVRRGGFGGERSTERKTARAGFMGKAWDGGDIAFRRETWVDVMRVMKPGANLVAFGGSRTFHRIACAIEDAGFEYRDTLMWIYGSGFPKSHDVSKGIDKALGAERAVVGFEPRSATRPLVEDQSGGKAYRLNGDTPLTAPASAAAAAWQGWGTALKPAFEPIILARKPLVGTVAANVLAHGVGGINIDACRIETDDVLHQGKTGLASEKFFTKGETPEIEKHQSPLGRWPANVLHDGSDEVLEAFASFGDKSSPWIGNPNGVGKKGGAMFGGGVQSIADKPEYADSGTASRFFYCAKADADDRAWSKHPTVKPLDLIRWLSRLITPPGGHVLDLFAGSGTTGEAGRLEGFDVTLIERELEYVNDINRRLGRASGADTPLFSEASP